ncbi:hypothetical protein HF086_011289 [Spodoptera exigua]|uniref:Uncharacterized protein n=1 Tax=Spodoptera exigua TaxID=7107 RepID=A0A922SLQ3_SPOEX|nr:hypothetical protein HF086_011289 [Spodoptera exigua]
MSFQNKVVLVTGGSSGIGAAIAIKFAEEGAKVAIVGRNQEKLNDVAKKCGNPLVIQADVTNDVDVKRIVNETVKNYGQIDVLVNNAGIVQIASIEAENAIEVFDKVMSTNLRSVVYLTNIAVPYLKKTKGNIINISSIAGICILSKEGFCYDTSKAALDHFTRSIALELASSGVRVNVINPGPVKTDIISNMGTPKETEDVILKNMQSMTALGRISGPEEIAHLALFLASDKADLLVHLL